MSSTTSFTPASAMLEVSMMNADASTADFDDVIVDALNRGLPPEMVMRFRDLWSVTKKIGNEVIAIGKIVVMAIIRFLRENKDLALGLAIGAAVAYLVASIPILGPLLAPYAAILAPMYGAGHGAATQAGQDAASPIAIAKALAAKFFEFLRLVFSAVSERWAA